MESMENEGVYTKAFDTWFDKGNRLLKIGDTVFLLILIDTDCTALIYACDNVHTYKGWMRIPVFGKMISEKRTGLLINIGMEHTTLYNFAFDLIWADHCYGKDVDNTLFSFDQIDTEQLPGWIVEELVKQKLSRNSFNFLEVKDDG